MNSTIRKSRSIADLCRSLHKHLRQKQGPQTLFAYKHFTVNPKSIHAQSSQPNSLELASPIFNLLSNGGTWDSLCAGFGFIELTNDLIERVLLDLKEPMNTKKALVFFHWTSQHRQFKHTLRTYCIIVHILVRSGLLIDARALLESAIKKNSETRSSTFLVVESLLATFEATSSCPRVFDLLIQTYSKMRMVEPAFDACRHLGGHGFSLSLISFNKMLHVAQKSDWNDLAWKIYEHMIVKRVYPNQDSIKAMIDVMCKEGTMRKMIDVLDRIHGKGCAPAVIVNTAVALRMLDENRIEDTIVLLKRLLQKNLVLDVVVHSLIIFAHCKTGQLELAYELYDDMLSRGCSSNAFVYTTFIRVHCKEGRIEEAARLMQEMQSIGLKPYDDTYNSLIEGYLKMGRVEESLVLYGDMVRKGFLLDCFACNEMMGRICESGEVEKADEILTALLDKGFVPNEATYVNLIDGFGNLKKAQQILKLFYEMEHRGLDPGPEVYTSLIRNLCRCGKLKEAGNFLTVMEGRLLSPTWCMYDAMIRGYCETGDTEKALCFYDNMTRKKFKPYAHTFMMLVKRTLEAKTIECDSKVLEILRS